MKFIELIKKHKVYILSALVLIFFFRSCIKSTDTRKMNDMVMKKEITIDSLQNVINYQKDTLDSYPETLRLEKIKIHSDYDNYISEKDRGEQLMELHMIVKQNIKKLQDVK